MTTAPIVLFVYNRPHHTLQTLEALSRAEFASDSFLYVYCDGPKSGASLGDLQNIEETRRLVKSKLWCGEVNVIESNENKGLASSIVYGVSKVVNQHGRVIVLEDDIVVEPGFLRFMNEALALYEDNARVMQINGGIYDADIPTSEETFFLRVMYCQGWATWKRAWAVYNTDALDHLAYFETNIERSIDFDVEGSAQFMEQLRRNVDGRLNTWAVRWYASWLRAGGLALFPRHSFVQNIGFDGSGVHCDSSQQSYLKATGSDITVQQIRSAEQPAVREAVAKFFKSYWRKSNADTRLKKTIATPSSIKGFGWTLGRKIVRRILSTIFPELKPLWNACATGQLSLINLVSQERCLRVGKSVSLAQPHRFRCCIIGDWSYVSKNADVSYTEIGKFCSIGPNFSCGWGVHPIEGVSTSPSFYSLTPANGQSFGSYSSIEERKKITIGNDVFIGMNVTVLDGVTIGDGAVIGAGCVVSKDVPPYAVAVGCPIKILRYRFDQRTREKLQKIRWWDWSEEKLKEFAGEFSSVEKFTEQFKASQP